MPTEVIRYKKDPFNEKGLTAQIAFFELEAYPSAAEEGFSWCIKTDDHTLDYGNTSSLEKACQAAVDCYNENYVDLPTAQLES